MTVKRNRRVGISCVCVYVENKGGMRDRLTHRQKLNIILFRNIRNSFFSYSRSHIVVYIKPSIKGWVREKKELTEITQKMRKGIEHEEEEEK